MAKKKVSQTIKELRDLVKEDKIVIGSHQVLKKLKQKKIKKVYLADNCREDIEKEINHLCQLYSIELKKLSYPSEELGTLVKKPFFISVLGVK